MGQYWYVVNLDKKEFVHPHKLGTGLKLWEQVASHPSTGSALLILCAAMPEQRGGGDLGLSSDDDPKYEKIARRTIGRWAGDRIALVGDYAEDSDLPKRFKASKIMDRCSEKTHLVYNKNPKGCVYRVGIDSVVSDCNGTRPDPNAGLYAHYVVDAPPEYKDISADVCAVIEYELGGKFEGDGWRTFKYRDEK